MRGPLLTSPFAEMLTGEAPLCGSLHAPFLALAARTVEAAPPALHDPLDRGAAHAAGLAGAIVDGVSDLEGAGLAVGVAIVGDRTAAELDGFLEHGAQGDTEAFELLAAQAGGATARADAGLEE